MLPERVKEPIDDAEHVANVLGCLASPARLIIICSLLDGEKNVTHFVKKLGTTMGNISQHLRVLEENEIIKGRKEGNKVFYRIVNRDVIKLIREIKKICNKGKIGRV